VVKQVLGAMTIVLGLLFAGAFDRFTVTGRILRPSIRPRAGLASAPFLGVLFALSWTPLHRPHPRSRPQPRLRHRHRR
jgi:cytochrome c-type biogenesis protein